MFSVRTLTREEARLVAQAYLKAGRNPNAVAAHLGSAEFDKSLLAHPLVRREIVSMARVHADKYTLDQHMEKLAEIRDAALEDAKYSAALGAELSLGKAAGLYDKSGGEDPDGNGDVDATKLTTDQIRAMLLRGRGAEGLLPAPEAMPEGVEEDDRPEEAEPYVPPSDLNEDGLA